MLGYRECWPFGVHFSWCRYLLTVFCYHTFSMNLNLKLAQYFKQIITKYLFLFLKSPKPCIRPNIVYVCPNRADRSYFIQT